MKPLFLFFGHLKIVGYENVKALDAPIILAPNHSHSLDAVLLPLAFPLWSKFSPLFYVARPAQLYSGWRKIAFSLQDLNFIGSYPLIPNKKDYGVALQKHEDLLRNGNTLCIFPEGGTTKDGTIRDAHGGVAYLADVTKRPIVPVHISGTFQLTFMDLIKRKNKLTISFLDPIFPEELSKQLFDNQNDYREAAQIVVGRLRSYAQEHRFYG